MELVIQGICVLSLNIVDTSYCLFVGYSCLKHLELNSVFAKGAFIVI